MKWGTVMNLFHWHRAAPPPERLDAAIAANEEARQEVQEAEAVFTQQLLEQRERSEATLNEIRGRVERPSGRRDSSPALVAIESTLKSLERPS